MVRDGSQDGALSGAVISWGWICAIIDRLHSEIVRALKAPDLRDRLVGLGADPVGNTPEQYTAFMQNEIAKWDKVIKAAGIKGE